MTNQCVFNSTEPKDIEYIYSCYFNKQEVVRFSSNVGKFVGYTEFGVKQAEYWNNDPAEIGRRRQEKERYCQHNVPGWYNIVLTKSGEFVFLPHPAPSHHQLIDELIDPRAPPFTHTPSQRRTRASVEQEVMFTVGSTGDVSHPDFTSR